MFFCLNCEWDSNPKGRERKETVRWTVSHIRFGDESDLFGREKDDSFRGSIGNIYQSFGGVDLYPTLEEKAAHLLYFVTKNHSFLDGNKRIAVTMFLYFLDKNGHDDHCDHELYEMRDLF